MKLAFFCAGSATQGMGHLLRCLAFAQEVVSQQGSVLFFLNETASNLAKNRSDWVGEIITVDDTFCAANFEHHVFISEQPIEWIVVDAYHVHASFFRACKATQSKLLLFDDLHYQQALHWADVVVNAAVESIDDVPQYREVKHITRFALGAEYVLLRKEFTCISRKPFATRRYLTVCFGGSDPDNLTCEILKSLAPKFTNLAFSLPIQVVTGPAFQYLNELETVLSLYRGKVEIVHRHNVQNMAEIWHNTRLAISAGGGAQFELKACGTPSILVVVAENQRQASMASQREGWCKTLVFKKDVFTLAMQITTEVSCFFQNKERLTEMHRATCTHHFSQGTSNLLRLLQAHKGWLMKSGNKENHCNICDHGCDHFDDFGSPVRKNVLCPSCHSLERHRLLWMYWQKHTSLFDFSKRLKVLHFAPERAFYHRLKEQEHIDYFPCDLHPEHYADLKGPEVAKVDMTDIPYDDGAFDVIICNHVLEHIPDDHSAMCELKRVMKRSGWGVFQVPIKYNLEKTYEDFSITSPEGRAKAFGQHDHVRWYGCDYPLKLAQAGFNVNEIDYANSFSVQEIKKYGLPVGEIIYQCTVA